MGWRWWLGGVLGMALGAGIGAFTLSEPPCVWAMGSGQPAAVVATWCSRGPEVKQLLAVGGTGGALLALGLTFALHARWKRELRSRPSSR